MSNPDQHRPGYRGSLACASDGRISIQVSDTADPAAAHARTSAGAGVEVTADAGLQTICPTCGTRYPGHFSVCPTDGAKLSKADELVGTTLGGTYIITRILGEGGMGRVYEARHARVASKRFALKTLHPELAQHPDILARFRREAEASASIRSPHVVDVYDFSQTADGRPYLVSQLLEGRELGDHLMEVGPIAIGLAVRIARQVCDGLAAAHAIGVVHRDMKPENVFLMGDIAAPTAKILDFGIARLGERSNLTQTGMVMGTPSYMAPEQARGDPLDHRADLYAVGAILYRALTGQPPFDRDDPSATLLAVLSEEPTRPSGLRPDIPLELELVIQRAMAKDPSQRYATAEELSRALAPFDMADEGAAAATAPGQARSRAAAPAPVVLSAAQGDLARAVLIGSAVAGALGLGAALVTSIAGLSRLAQRGAPLSGSGAALLLLGVGLGVGGPAIAGALRVRRRLWRDDAGVLALAARLQWPVALGLGAYGFASLLERLVDIFLLRAAIGAAWPAWDPLLSLIGLATAAVTFLYQRAQLRA